MRRRDALKAAGSMLGVGVLGSAATGSAAAHPGPYEPYGHVELEGTKEAVVSPDGDVAYVATTTGYAAVDVSVPDRPQVLADVRDPVSEHEAGPLREIHDVNLDAESNTLAVVGPANSRPGAVSGVLLVDVSDPAAPERVSFVETSYPIHNCFLRGGVAYLTGNDGEDNPLVLVDAASGEELGRWALSDADPAWGDVDASLRPLHDVFVRGDVAHLSLWDAGTWLVDVSDPSDLTAVGSVEAPDPTTLSSLSSAEVRGRPIAPPGNHHYSATDESGDLLAVGKESWARRADATDAGTETGTGEEQRVGGPSGIDLWDVSDPAAPERLSTIAPPPSPDPTYGGVWTTAHNFQIRDGRLYSSWYQGGVKRHDVSDPRNPRQLSWWRAPEKTRFWSAELAVPGAREGFFVASSMGVDDVPGRLYTFPDHAGQQADPPTLVADEGGGATTEPVVVTATDEAGESAGTTTRSPGFGVGAAVGSVSLAGWLLRRRTGAGGDDSGNDTRRS
ncbi:LVIVD repeat-containing protein [Halopelagius longus]|uniref:Uncharacterized conserved protein n=1 Tax=Halopelagius longus TaxID=1236180 RepID=A0A1H1DXT9_9EURY|nr:hypothetical protein [Halopelagius longus]SDQ81304.1 Uncharacterized conserved protein [Halopelagius longus]